MKKMEILTNGLVKENPVLRLVIGTCPTLAVTTAVSNGIGMGIAATFVLICSNIVISALRKIIPDKVHIPAFITIIAGFVTIVQMVVKAYAPALDSALGVYLPLIVVNCIILGRAEMFACKNTVLDSALDGVGMGLGFTLTLVVMSAIREVLGAGSFLGIQIISTPMAILASPPGGFFVFGVLIACAVALDKKMGKKVETDPEKMGCAGCMNAAACQAAEGGDEA
ncbi:MAG: electron transport complex subunit E [Pygmaiobacter massiliensis]|nr:electron transport complex subunit E [Pygmaiobacter massiliensis]